MKKIKVLFVIMGMTFLSSCGSGKIIPTTDVCSLEKHWKDSVFQVRINEQPISKHYYTYQEAVAITSKLGDQNKCMN